jgi:hypothetical protein
VGELGWELYVPAEFAVGAYEELITAGVDLGLANAGYYVRHPEDQVLTADIARTGTYQVNVGGHLYKAAVHLRPPFDPTGDRIKGRYDHGAKRATVSLLAHRHQPSRPSRHRRWPRRGAPSSPSACTDRP